MGTESEKSFTRFFGCTHIGDSDYKNDGEKNKVSVGQRAKPRGSFVVPKPKVDSQVTKFPCTVYHPLPISTQSSVK